MTQTEVYRNCCAIWGRGMRKYPFLWRGDENAPIVKEKEPRREYTFYTAEQKAEVLNLVKSGFSASQIEKKTGISKSSAQRIALKAGIHFCAGPQKMTPEKRSKIVEMIKKGINRNTIAIEMHTGRAKVVQIAREEGIYQDTRCAISEGKRMEVIALLTSIPLLSHGAISRRTGVSRSTVTRIANTQKSAK